MRLVGVRLAPVLCVAFLIVAAPARALDHVRMSITATSSDAGTFLAVRKGYFRDEGLDVELIISGMGVNTMAPLGAGELDVASTSAGAVFYNAVARGVGVKLVASVSNAPPGYGHNLLIVRKALIDSGRYARPTDIKGMRVAMPVKGSSATATLNAWLTRNGLGYSDIEPVYLTYPNHVVALANGSIDVGLTTEPQASQAINAGSAVRVTSDDVMDPGHEASVMVFSEKFIKERPEVGLRFMRAFIRGQRDYNLSLKDGKIAGPNADEVIATLVEMTELKDPAIYRAIAPQGAQPDGALNIASLEKDFAFYKTQGWIEGNVTVAQSTDTSFAARAASELGPWKP